MRNLNCIVAVFAITLTIAYCQVCTYGVDPVTFPTFVTHELQVDTALPTLMVYHEFSKCLYFVEYTTSTGSKLKRKCAVSGKIDFTSSDNVENIVNNGEKIVSIATNPVKNEIAFYTASSATINIHDMSTSPISIYSFTHSAIAKPKAYIHYTSTGNRLLFQLESGGTFIFAQSGTPLAWSNSGRSSIQNPVGTSLLFEQMRYHPNPNIDEFVIIGTVTTTTTTKKLYVCSSTTTGNTFPALQSNTVPIYSAAPNTETLKNPVYSPVDPNVLFVIHGTATITKLVKLTRTATLPWTSEIITTFDSFAAEMITIDVLSKFLFTFTITSPTIKVTSLTAPFDTRDIIHTSDNIRNIFTMPTDTSPEHIYFKIVNVRLCIFISKLPQPSLPPPPPPPFFFKPYHVENKSLLTALFPCYL